METVINKLAEIEIGATKILENANAEKSLWQKNWTNRFLHLTGKQTPEPQKNCNPSKKITAWKWKKIWPI